MSIYCLFALPKKDSIHLPKIYLSWIAVKAEKKHNFDWKKIICSYCSDTVELFSTISHFRDFNKPCNNLCIFNLFSQDSL